MEEAYGVGVTNRYALFLDEDGDFDASASPQKSGLKPAPGAKLPAKPAVQDSKSSQAAKDQSRTRKPNDRNNNQAPRPQGGQRTGGGGDGNLTRSPRGGGGQGSYEGGDVAGDRQGKDGRRGGFRGGRGEGRGGRGGGARTEGGPRPEGARRFGDRHSGSNRTGVKATDKREGSGSHNWGRAEDGFQGEEEGAGAPGAEPTENNENAQPAGGENAGGEERVEAPVDDEPPTKTLEDFKREREAARLATTFNTRKPNEGEDKSKWKKTYVLPKKPAEEDEEVEYEEIEVEEDSKKGKHRKLLDIAVAFKPSEDTRGVERRERGGRFGGGRGRGGPRDGPRDDRPRGDRGDRGDGGAPREPREPREPRDYREPREPRGDRGDGGAPREHREPREPREPRGDGNRSPRGDGGAPGAGGRGGFGGRGGRGGARGGRGFQATPRVDDYNDFPSL